MKPRHAPQTFFFAVGVDAEDFIMVDMDISQKWVPRIIPQHLRILVVCIVGLRV